MSMSGKKYNFSNSSFQRSLKNLVDVIAENNTDHSPSDPINQAGDCIWKSNLMKMRTKLQLHLPSPGPYNLHCTLELAALLRVSLIGAILSHVPARDNLARPTGPPTYIYGWINLGYIIYTHPCKKDDIYQEYSKYRRSICNTSSQWGFPTWERVYKERIKLCLTIWCICSQ